MYCDLARQIASEAGVELKETGHPTLPFMGPSGCTVPPHLRPICTLHVCSINSLGFDPNDLQWTEKYFELREKIEEAHYGCEVSNDETLEAGETSSEEGGAVQEG